MGTGIWIRVAIVLALTVLIVIISSSLMGEVWWKSAPGILPGAVAGLIWWRKRTPRRNDGESEVDTQ